MENQQIYFKKIDNELKEQDKQFLTKFAESDQFANLVVLYGSLEELGVKINPIYKIKKDEKDQKVHLHYFIKISQFMLNVLNDSISEDLNHILDIIKETCNTIMKEYICLSNETYNNLEMIIDSDIEYLPSKYIMNHDKNRSLNYLKTVLPYRFNSLKYDLEFIKYEEGYSNLNYVEDFIKICMGV